MNKEYLKKFYEENIDEFIDREVEVNSLEEFEDYLITNITSNLQYDFNLDIDIDKLFNNTPSINIGVNNNRTLRLEQTESDIARGGIALLGINEYGDVDRRDLIEEGDFVMLMNYYHFVKDHDIKDDFINRDGINKLSDFSYSQNDLDR